ncbi:unnamed protein product [Rotaria sordida]|uniref:NACHT domain-containing protein n=2 Tax=Rotaria sordida TaxID=392033 RepID=A0A819KSK4_9BILA|nr:unnamed protein product [Rotaria sordida]CAF3953531.1 unnamed protein product [Rotaria sordida]
MANTLETRLYNTLKRNPNSKTVKELIEQGVDCNLSHFDPDTRSIIFPIQLASKTNRHDTLCLLYEHRNRPTKLQLEKHLTFYINHYDQTQEKKNEILFDYIISRLLYGRIIQYPKNVFNTLIAALHDYDNATHRGERVSKGSLPEIFLQLRIYTLFRVIIDMNINSDNDMFTIIENELLHNLETFYFLIGISSMPVVISERIINDKFSEIRSSQRLLIKYYKCIAKNVIYKIEQLEINQEYTIPTGWESHAVCVSFQRISQTHIVIRIDNPSGCHLPDEHEICQSTISYNRIEPKILGQLHVDNLQKNVDYFILLIDSVKRKLTCEEGRSLIYNLNTQIHHLEKISTENILSFEKQADWNCFFKCFEPGMRIRLGRKHQEIYQHCLLCEKNNANLLAKRCEEEDQHYLYELFHQFVSLSKEEDITAIPITEKMRFQNKLKTSYKQHYKHIMSNINIEIGHLLNDIYIPLRFENNNISIELKNLFIKSRILMLGEAGCGKTTVCQYITYSWAIGKLWRNQFEWIFYIKIRNLSSEFFPKQPNNYSLIDIIERECFQGSKLHNLDKQKLTNMLENSSNILWILDGCDERMIPRHLLSIERELLEKPNLLLTSRPYAIHNFKNVAQVQVQNFTDQDIEKYIYNYFSLTLRTRGNKCWLFIRSSEQLLRTARIPACLEIICNLWENGTVRLDSDMMMGQLYQKMCNYLLRRYLLKYHRLCKAALARRDIYQEPKARAFAHLEYLAFQATKSHRFTISGEEITNVAHSLFLSVLQIGLLIPETQNSSPFTKKIYYFIHRSFQEYLCACYIIKTLESSNSNERKREVIQFITYEKYNRYTRETFRLFFESERSNLCTEQFWSAIESEPRDLVGLRHCSRIAQWFPNGSCIFPREDIQEINRRTIDAIIGWISNRDRRAHDFGNTYIFEWFADAIDHYNWLSAWRDDLFIESSLGRRYFLPDLWSIENINTLKKIYDTIPKNVYALHRLITTGPTVISLKRLLLDPNLFILNTVDNSAETSEFIIEAQKQAKRREAVTTLAEFQVLLQNYTSFANLNHQLATIGKEIWKLEIAPSVLENIDKETLDLLSQLLQQNILFFRDFKLSVIPFLKLYANQNDLDDDILCSCIVLITMSSDCLLTASPDQNKLIRVDEKETFTDITLDQQRWLRLLKTFDHARHIYGYSTFFEQDN